MHCKQRGATSTTERKFGLDLRHRIIVTSAACTAQIGRSSSLLQQTRTMTERTDERSAAIVGLDSSRDEMRPKSALFMAELPPPPLSLSLSRRLAAIKPDRNSAPDPSRYYTPFWYSTGPARRKRAGLSDVVKGQKLSNGKLHKESFRPSYSSRLSFKG